MDYTVSKSDYSSEATRELQQKGAQIDAGYSLGKVGSMSDLYIELSGDSDDEMVDGVDSELLEKGMFVGETHKHGVMRESKAEFDVLSYLLKDNELFIGVAYYQGRGTQWNNYIYRHRHGETVSFLFALLMLL